MPTYKENVQVIAEEMAKAKYPISWPLLTKRQRLEQIEEHMPAAHVAGKRMWVAAQLAYENGYMDMQEGKPCDFEAYASNIGLIPDQEAGSDGNN